MTCYVDSKLQNKEGNGKKITAWIKSADSHEASIALLLYVIIKMSSLNKRIILFLVTCHMESKLKQQ